MGFKRPITAEQFSVNDDCITGLLFDTLGGFKTPIRKVSSTYNPLEVPQQRIAAIIAFVARQGKLSEAISCVMKLLDPLDSQLFGTQHFKRQLESYMKIYLPDCPFEISTTERYSVTPEACVMARKSIQKGVIKYLSGILLPLTEEEENSLEVRGQDFSLVTSTRTKRILLFLGPGRFANHDCNANAEFAITSDGIQLVALRKINVGEEITVDYGNSYFGEGNCLCASCKPM